MQIEVAPRSGEAIIGTRKCDVRAVRQVEGAPSLCSCAIRDGKPVPNLRVKALDFATLEPLERFRLSLNRGHAQSYCFHAIPDGKPVPTFPGIALGPDLWFADGEIVSFKGFDYPTRMAVARLSDGGLWLWSPVQKSVAIEAEIRALGPVRHIVSPNRLHYLFLGDWQAAFPDAALWATAATIAGCKEFRFSGALAEEPPLEWEGQIDQFYFANSLFMDELIFFHNASRTAIIADLSQTFSEAFLERHWPWWMRPIAKLSKMVEGWGYPPAPKPFGHRHRACMPSGMSRAAFSSEFARRAGRPPLTHLRTWRLTVARAALVSNESTVAALARKVGFISQSAFGHAFKREFGRPP